MIFQKSLDSGEVPKAWREINISQLFNKKDSHLDRFNLRPVSLTSILCKIIKKLIKNNIMTFLDKYKL